MLSLCNCWCSQDTLAVNRQQGSIRSIICENLPTVSKGGRNTYYGIIVRCGGMGYPDKDEISPLLEAKIKKIVGSICISCNERLPKVLCH